jgi:pyridoxine 5-phosphate synthase
LFIDAVPEQIEAAARAGAPVIELHTGHYAEARGPKAQHYALQKIIQGAALAHRLGLQVNAGHGLHYHNVSEIARIPEIRELNIGHAIIARALFSGLPSAVSEMKSLMVTARNQSIDR